MGKEIERKFLLRGEEWRQGAKGVACRQGYLCRSPECTVRVRTVEGKAWLTVKGPTVGLARTEYEYEIPLAAAEDMLENLAAKPLIEKKRYVIPFDGLIWEVDEFAGANAGLIVAEVELDSAEQNFSKPAWVGAEVTHDPRYFNSNLVTHPYSEWA